MPLLLLYVWPNTLSKEDTLSVEHQQKKAKMSTCRDPKYDYPRYTHKEYLREIREMKNLIEAGMLGWPGPGNKDDMFHTLTFTVDVQSFVIEHAKVKPEDVDHLSDTQKQTIISHLAGYCVQEKWEVLMGLLPDLVREKVLEVFLETLIYKDIFERFFVNFFWYFDGKMSPTDEGDETFTARLKHLYDQFYASMYTTSLPKERYVSLTMIFHCYSQPTYGGTMEIRNEPPCKLNGYTQGIGHTTWNLPSRSPPVIHRSICG